MRILNAQLNKREDLGEKNNMIEIRNGSDQREKCTVKCQIDYARYIAYIHMPIVISLMNAFISLILLHIYIGAAYLQSCTGQLHWVMRISPTDFWVPFSFW